jgi:hypothetical protein
MLKWPWHVINCFQIYSHEECVEQYKTLGISFNHITQHVCEITIRVSLSSI